MELTASDEQSASMVLLFGAGLGVYLGFLGLNVPLDIMDLRWSL